MQNGRYGHKTHGKTESQSQNGEPICSLCLVCISFSFSILNLCFKLTFVSLKFAKILKIARNIQTKVKFKKKHYEVGSFLGRIKIYLRYLFGGGVTLEILKESFLSELKRVVMLLQKLVSYIL